MQTCWNNSDIDITLMNTTRRLRGSGVVVVVSVNDCSKAVIAMCGMHARLADTEMTCAVSLPTDRPGRSDWRRRRHILHARSS